MPTDTETKKSPLIIVPTLNESDNISLLVNGIMANVPDCSILFIDDHSTDGTRDEIKSQAESHPERIFLVERPAKMGLGTAYIHGFKWGIERQFQRIVQMDADLSHDPKYLPEMLRALETHSLVIGSRYVRGGGTRNWSAARRVISRFGSLYARWILSIPIRDFTGGFNAWQADMLRQIDLDAIRSNGYVFQIEMKTRAYRRGASMRELPIIFVDRQIGQSKMSSGIIYEAMWRVFALRFTVRSAEPKPSPEGTR